MFAIRTENIKRKSKGVFYQFYLGSKLPGKELDHKTLDRTTFWVPKEYFFFLSYKSKTFGKLKDLKCFSLSSRAWQSARIKGGKVSQLGWAGWALLVLFV